MKLFSSIFNKSNNTQSTLLSKVNKKENSIYGVFVNITNDLSDFSDEVGLNGDPLILMAYAYARRSAAAGMFLQGLISIDDYNYVCDLFVRFQQFLPPFYD